MQVQVTVPEWLKLPMPVRMQMIKIFELKRSEGTRIDGNVVVSDGYNHNDLAGITTEKMQIFLNEPKNTDFVKLFNQVVVKLTEIPPPPKSENPTRQELLLEEWALTLGKMQSQAVFFKLEVQLQELINKLVPPIAMEQKKETHDQNTQGPQGLPAKKGDAPRVTKEQIAETTRIRLLVKEVLYPILLRNSQSVRDARNITKNLIVGLDAGFYMAIKKEQERLSDGPLSELEMIKVLKEGKENTAEWLILMNLKDEKVGDVKSIVEGLGDEIQRLVEKDIIDKPLSELKTEWL